MPQKKQDKFLDALAGLDAALKFHTKAKEDDPVAFLAVASAQEFLKEAKKIFKR